MHKGGVKENIQENQRGILLVNIVSKIYESTLKMKIEKKKGEYVINANSWKKTKTNSR